MFPFITRTWNPLGGECPHHCSYFWARRLAAERERKIWEKLKEIEVKQNLILQDFRGSGVLKYSPPLLQRFACEDAVDLAILERVFQAGASGILPKDVASDAGLRQYELKHYHVSRKVVRMNKRLSEEMGECLFEKRGLKWALTSFAFEVWGEAEGNRLHLAKNGVN